MASLQHPVTGDLPDSDLIVNFDMTSLLLNGERITIFSKSELQRELAEKGQRAPSKKRDDGQRRSLSLIPVITASGKCLGSMLFIKDRDIKAPRVKKVRKNAFTKALHS